MEEAKTKKFIDVEGVIREKNPGLFKILPRFILNWIKRKVHQDKINAGIEIYKDVYEHDFNEAALNYVGAKVTWEGLENLPATGGVIIASNHPLGGLDGMALIKAVSNVRKDVRFLVNDILLKLVNFRDLFVGVNKMGKTGADALKVIDEMYSSEHALLVFPAGLVSRKQQGVIKDLQWKKSFITQSIKHQRTIVPVFIDGQNSKFFYNFALWRKRLGIKTNIEMFFLADEMMKQNNKVIHVKVGKPFSYELLDKRHNHLEWAQLVKAYVYEMGRNSQAPSFEEFVKDK
ncbi:MAG: glycerol acyltransferase [Bacteroidetes bacterium]|jgi:putative hemolysin|nr:glycerol acyltransferase [Bacteroidota bacterium]